MTATSQSKHFLGVFQLNSMNLKIHMKINRFNTSQKLIGQDSSLECFNSIQLIQSDRINMKVNDKWSGSIATDRSTNFIESSFHSLKQN